MSKEKDLYEEFEKYIIKPEKPKFTDEQFDAMMLPYTIHMMDKKGDEYRICMSVAMWDWYLIYTFYDRLTDNFLDYAIEWKERNQSEWSISLVFETLLTEIVRIRDPIPYDLTGYDAHHRDITEYLEAESHPLYDELPELQWRIKDKRYPIPIPPFPRRPEIFEQ